MTVPREARALLGKEGVAHLRGLQHVLPRAGDGELFRYVVLMTEDELKRREQAILDAADVPAEAKLQLITELNGGSAFMALDGQHRIVLPKHFVAWLELDQDVLFNSTNTTIQVWNPQHFLRWSGRDAGPVHNPQLSRFLAI